MVTWIYKPIFWMGVLSILLVIYSVFRAANLSMTHDESHTFLAFHTQPIWPCFFSTHCWETANNHLLNTLLMQQSVRWFGVSELTIRLPNVLGQVVFLGYSIAIVRLFTWPFLTALAAFVLLNFNPYLIDFFGLARGYGLSVAFFLAAIYYLLIYIKVPWPGLWPLLGLYVSGFLSIMANFTALNFIFCLSCLQVSCSVYLVWSQKINLRKVFGPLIIPVFFGLLLFFLLKLPISVLKEKGEFLYGAASAWDTLKILAQDILYGQNYLGGQTILCFLLFILLGLIASIFLAIYYFKFSNAVTILPLVLCGLGLGAFSLMIIQHLWLDSSYLFNRKAILFIPAFTLMLISGLNQLRPVYQRVMSMVILILLSWHLLRCLNLSFCREWWYDKNTKTVMRELNSQVKGREQPITLGTNWLFMPTAEFYRVTLKMDQIAPLVYDKSIQGDGRFDFYFIDYNDWPILQSNYEKVMEFDSGSRFLLQKKKE